MENDKVKVETIVRTVTLALALINQFLTVYGASPIPIENETVELLISTGVTAAAALWGWWKNNSFTYAAKKGDEVMREIKANTKG